MNTPYKLGLSRDNIHLLQNYHSLSMMKVTLKSMGLETVPVIDEYFTPPETIEDILKYADDKSKLNPDFDREGIVVRTLDRKISFKVISNKFLLNEK